MTSNTDTFNPQELCSRKLWDIVSNHSGCLDNESSLKAAVAELEERRSYLQELQDLGHLGDRA